MTLRSHVRLGLLAGAIALGLAHPALGAPLVEDNLPAFLSAVGDGSGMAWITFEVAQSRTLDQLFYKDRSSAQKLAMARNGLVAGVPVWQLREFEQRWQVDYDAVAPRVEALIGGPANFMVSMWYALDTRPDVYAEVDGKPTLGLNARFMLPYEPQKTRLKIAEAFFRVYAEQSTSPNPEPLTLSRRLQLTGLDLAAMQRVVPGLSMDRYLGVTPATLKQYRKHQKQIAHALLAALDGPDSANQIERFFGRGLGDGWPNGAGRYMGFLLAHDATRGRNPLELFVEPSSDYLFQVRPALEAMASAPESP